MPNTDETNNNKNNIPYKMLATSFSMIGAESATGQCIATIFKNLPKENLFTFCKSSITSPISNACQISLKDNYTEEIQRARLFNADICYFYLIRDINYLKFVLLLIENLRLPYVIHFMDDWLRVVQEENPQEYAELFDLTKEIIENASECYAISSPMAGHYAQIFNKNFSVLHNFISNNQREEICENAIRHKPEEIKILYSGALDKNVNKEIVLDIAKAVSDLAKNYPIFFEIRTFACYTNDFKPLIEDLENITLHTISANDDYPQCLYNADLLVFTQNFTEHTQTYMKYSLGNKIPEYLMTKKPILAYGPDSIYSFSLLKEHNAAININTHDTAQLKKTLQAFCKEEIGLTKLEKNGQTLLDEEFSEEKILIPFENKLRELSALSGGSKKNSTAVILGNGPSLKGFDFKENLKDYITFGLNVAYRYWDTINWYPDYYCCLDLVVGISHKDEIERLIENSDEYGIKQFLLRDNLIQELGEIKNSHKIINFDKIYQSSNFMAERQITTGSHATAWAAEMGFKNILLLGIDSNYVEFIPEAKLNEDKKLVMLSTPKENPNYFFEGYQQVGDKYNIPNPNSDPDKMVHRVSWKNLSHVFVKNGVLVINANMQSKLDYFHKVPFDETETLINQIRTQSSIVSVHDLGRNISEDDILLNYFEDFKGTVIEVGAHFGSDTLQYLARGWHVHAFEPDEKNREKCELTTYDYLKNLKLNPYAVSDKSDEELNFYTSKESTGISSLHPFHHTHEASTKVKTIALKDYISKEKIKNVDLLRIDTEGYDLKVLQGFPFDTMKPEIILCEFEDNKTLALGYSTQDMIEFLQNLGYTVYISEWCPIVKYGVPHSWKQLIKSSAKPFSPNSWGNLLAFKNDPDEEKLKELAFKPVSKVKSKPIKLSKLVWKIFFGSLLGFFSKNMKKQKCIYKKVLSTMPYSVVKQYFFVIPFDKIIGYEGHRHHLLFSIIPFMYIAENEQSYRLNIFGLQVFKKISNTNITRVYIFGLRMFKTKIERKCVGE